MLLLILLALQSPTYRLTVLGGSGSGVYACGATVQIVGDRTHGSQVFGQWANPNWDGTAIERVHQRKARLKMPCHDVTVEARFTAGPPKR